MNKNIWSSISVLVLCTALPGCAFLPIAARVPANPPPIFTENVKEPRKALVPDENDSSKLVTKYFSSDWQQLLNAEHALREDDTEEARKEYLDAGFNVSSQLCTTWLNILISAQRDVEFGQGVTSTLGALTTTLMAAFNAATKEIAGASATFAALGTTYELSKATFLFTPDLSLVKGKIEDAQRDFQSKTTDDAIKSARAAEAAVRAHYGLCSSSKIQELIQTAVIKTSYSIDLPGKLSEIEQSRIEVESVRLNEAITGEALPIPVEALRRLYFATFHPGVLPPDKLQGLEADQFKAIANSPKAKTLLQGIAAIGRFEDDVPRAREWAQKNKAVNATLSPEAFRADFDAQTSQPPAGTPKISIVTRE